MEINSYRMSVGWPYLCDNEAKLGRVGKNVALEGLCDVEVVVAQTVRGFLGEIGSVSSAARMMKKLTI
jgi:hypothetical protein